MSVLLADSMSQATDSSQFTTKLLRPTTSGDEHSWAFLVLPKSVSEKLPRRGRTSVEGTINGHSFQATLEPDGQLSHWLKVDNALREASGAEIGDMVTLKLAPVENEPEPTLPPDFHQALSASPKAKAVWDATTTIARVDWIHWIESAKQARTRKSRVETACDKLAAGEKRVCCFDQSGFYSKSLSAPKAAE
ncbi:YdeI/OmpD-associated family protein [Acidovorax sp. BL-A-41-H1]|uniref:YdeI/OmpD-associated family protein n=1 Tax=Acidovorax sp. BL-A-41-H1 TaxID=3421102 RepID=UPI003F7A74C5